MKYYYKIVDGRVGKLLNESQLTKKGLTEADMVTDGREIAETSDAMYDIFADCGQSDIASLHGIFPPKVEYVEPAALTAIKSVLAAEIDSLNAKYPALELTATDTILSAIPKLLGVGALKDEVVYLKMLFDTVKEVQNG